MQDSNLIDRPVDGAGFDSHDIRNFFPEQGRRVGEVAGWVGRIRQPLERSALNRTIGIIHPAFDSTVVVQRSPEGLTRHEREPHGFTDERLFLGTGKHRSGYRVVTEVQVDRNTAASRDD